MLQTEENTLTIEVNLFDFEFINLGYLSIVLVKKLTIYAGLISSLSLLIISIK